MRRSAVNFVPRDRLCDETLFLNQTVGVTSPTAAGVWRRVGHARVTKERCFIRHDRISIFSLSRDRPQHGIFYIRERHAGH
jgi:hypothetical protein